MPEQDRVQRPEDHAREQPDIARREAQAEEDVEVAPGDHQRGAGDRGDNPECLAERDPLADHQPGQEDEEQGRGGEQQEAVDRRRQAEAEVDEAVEDRDSGQRKRAENAPFPQYEGALADQAAPGERQKNQERQRPAPEVEGDRRDQVARSASDHHVGRPEERRPDQQQVGPGQPACEPPSALLQLSPSATLPLDSHRSAEPSRPGRRRKPKRPLRPPGGLADLPAVAGDDRLEGRRR